MNKNNKSSQIQPLEKTLQKVKNGKGKFISHKLVTKWLKSWGTDNEIKAPSNFISK